jgi:regulator of replication initiation timing
LIEFLEEANKRRDAVISKASALFARLKAMGDENERMRNENAELKRRLEYRDKNEKLMDGKIKKLKRIVNADVSVRTPGVVGVGLKENLRPVRKF